MSDTDKLIDLLSKKEKVVGMLAPSFPIMFDPKTVVSLLKSMGFSYVVEVAVGAKKTNEQAVSILKNNPHTRFITSPCASFVRYMRTKHPDLLHHLAFEVDSPMVATAKIAHAKWPGYKPVFIGPCVVKKLEAIQDHPELDILVLTYRELQDAINKLKIAATQQTGMPFDLEEPTTRIYPVDGGLTDSSGARELLKPEEIRVVSGYKNCEIAVNEFSQNNKIRLLDILFCDGGCVMGPGISSPLSLEDRKKKILDYASSH